MIKIGSIIFWRKQHVCPRWLCFTFDNWIRRRIQNPDRIIKNYVRTGDTVVDIGPGIGFFTIPIARRVGTNGQVIAVDIQKEMLTAISKRADRAGVAQRITLQPASITSLNIAGIRADFILAFWMIHEVTDQEKFFTQLFAATKDDGKFLLAEPKLHVSQQQFQNEVLTAKNAGFREAERPAISLSHSILFVKGRP